MATQTIRLLKGWNRHAKGETLTLNGPIASELIKRGSAEAYDPLKNRDLYVEPAKPANPSVATRANKQHKRNS